MLLVKNNEWLDMGKQGEGSRYTFKNGIQDIK